jgi:hypothetical protein
MAGHISARGRAVAALIFFSLSPAIFAQDPASDPSRAATGSGSQGLAGFWIQENPANNPRPMRMQIVQNGSTATVWTSYTRQFTGFGNAARIRNGKATWKQPQSCAKNCRESGYNYDHPGFNLYRLSIEGTTLRYEQETHWLVPCGGHPKGVERVAADLIRTSAPRIAAFGQPNLNSVAPATPQERIPPASNPAPLPPGAKVITVWKVESEYTGPIPDAAVPPSLERSAWKLGFGLKVEGFAIQGFASRFFRAFEDHQAPDILVFDNYGVLQGSGDFPGIGTDPDIHAALLPVSESLSALLGPGWEYLIRTSPNHEAAQKLALRPPECPSTPEAPLPAGLSELAAQAARADLENSPSLRDLEDPDRLLTSPRKPIDRHVDEVKTCGGWGSDHLAFVQAVANYSSTEKVGWLTTLMVFRKQSDQWRMLVASTDPISNKPFVSQIPYLATLITQPWAPGTAPQPAEIVSPQDGQSPVPSPGARFGDFSWHTSPSSGEVAEIEEFAYDDDARLFAIFFSGPAPKTEHSSAGQLWTTGSTWKWRIWSISNSGAVSFSPAWSFPN